MDIKPEWIIYKEQRPIGQAVTWYRALDILVKLEGLDQFRVLKMAQLVTVEQINGMGYYKIVKER